MLVSNDGSPGSRVVADHVAAVRSQLLAHAGTAALVGDRVWHSALPQEEKGKPYMPAIVVQQISGVAEHVMGGAAGIVDLRIQVDVWADKGDRDGCQALTEQVRAALQSYSGTHGGVTLTFVGTFEGAPALDPEAKLWRAIQDFELWGSE